MAYAAGIFTRRFSLSRTLSETLDAFFGQKEQRKAQKSPSIGQDLIELSPASQVKQLMTEFHSFAVEGSSMSMKLTAPAPQEGTFSDDPAFNRDFDLMLRMIAKDDEDYARLKSQFEELLSLAQQDFQVDAESAAAEFEQTVVSQAKVQVRAALSQATRQRVEVGVEVTKTQQQTEVRGVDIKYADPLVLDLNGDGLDLTSAENGAIFDINADGIQDRTGWVQGDDALLVLDRNDNGKIDDGSELFGDQNGSANGFQELARYDDNQDGKINRQDQVFKALKLYRDLNGDGKVQDSEFSTLNNLGIKSLNLHFLRDSAKINGNRILLQSSFEREDGTTGKVADVLFAYQKP